MHLALALALALVCIARPTLALPVSPHQLPAYMPYWQPPALRNGVNCPPQICDESPNEAEGPGRSDPAELAELMPIKSTKRAKNTYKTGWTMGGMPFSVLYMNPKPQVSVRSPFPEPHRGLTQIYDSDLPQRDQPPMDSPQDAFVSNPRAQPLTSSAPSPSHPSRRQYSIIPQFFVSYGWGPLGK